MFPIRDHNPSYKIPFVTLFLIVITTLVFLMQITVPDPDVFIYTYALIPAKVNVLIPNSLLPFLFSIFLHGGWFHIISNMWFLWIFGDNIETKLGHMRYFLFYLYCGIIAGLLQYITNPFSDIPTLGASGAIAGVLGGYLVLFPRHKIDTLVPVFGGFLTRVSIPASIMLGYWFFIQLFSGIGSLGFQSEEGVAWFAHIGGFGAGWLVARVFYNRSVIENS